MKKIFIVILCFFLSACQKTTSYTITETKNLKIERDTIFEIEDDIISDCSVFDIDDNYVYLKANNKNNKTYEFYRLNKNNNLEHIYSYSYLKDGDSFLSLIGLISNENLYVIANNFNANTSKILKINNKKEQVLYENNSLLWVIYSNDDYLLIDEMINIGNKYNESYQQNYKYSKFY